MSASNLLVISRETSILFFIISLHSRAKISIACCITHLCLNNIGQFSTLQKDILFVYFTRESEDGQQMIGVIPDLTFHGTIKIAKPIILNKMYEYNIIITSICLVSCFFMDQGYQINCELDRIRRIFNVYNILDSKIIWAN